MCVVGRRKSKNYELKVNIWTDTAWTAVVSQNNVENSSLLPVSWLPGVKRYTALGCYHLLEKEVRRGVVTSS